MANENINSDLDSSLEEEDDSHPQELTVRGNEIDILMLLLLCIVRSFDISSLL